MHGPFHASHYAFPKLSPSLAFIFYHMASRKREKHEQHGIGVPQPILGV